MQRSMKHVIILISSILFVLVMLLCFSGKTFAAEPLPVASAEDGAEDTQQEKADPEAGPDGETGGSGEADAGRFTAVEDDAAHENKSGEEVSGDAADENNTSVVKNKVPEPEETENAVPEPEETENAVPEPAETENAVPEPAETENAVPEPAETENTVTDPAGKKDEVGTVNKVKPADPEPLAGLTGLSADKGNTVVTGVPGSDDLNDDSDDNSKDDSSSDKPDVTIDPLTYLQECLTYHGDEKDPSAYSLRAYTKDGQSVVTEVKDQNPWPTCWGFGAIAASETSILSECYAKWDQLAPGLREKYGINSFRELCEKLDLSERQIAWFTFMPEPKNGNYPSQEGEGLYANQEGIGGVYNALGASYYATSVFARGTGPLEEKDVPYQNNEGVLNDGVKITDKNGKEHIDRDYCDLIKETREIEYSFPIPQGMTKQELIDKFIGFPDIQEKVRQILEKGFFTDTETVCKYVDDSGKYYSIVRVNPLTDLLPEYPEILIYQGEDGKRYAYDPVTKTYPGLPALHKAYYDWSVDDSLHYASLLSLENTNILPEYWVDNPEKSTEDNIVPYRIVNEAAIKAIKDELLAGHGISASFYADTAAPGSTNKHKYMNLNNNAWAHYTYLSDTGTNHVVTIVGYNDRFPRTLIGGRYQPDQDGAWLVKNSWGGGKSTGTNFGNWGIDENGDGIGDGYFWLSYWDYSIGMLETFDYRVEDLISDRTEYDIRQYDLMSSANPKEYKAEKEANVFTAEITTNIREIGVQHASDNTTVSYEIYLLDKDTADPTDGILLTSGSEHYKYAGFHRIKTGKVCIIPEGQRYSIVVTQMRESQPYVSVFYDYNKQYVKDKESSGNTDIRKYSNAVVNRGESYVLNGGTWTDWADYIPVFCRYFESQNPDMHADWLAVDNFSIKAYADFINHDLRAEASEIGSGQAAATVGAADESDAEYEAMLSLALVYNEITNNETAAEASSVKEGYISADDHDHIAKTLIDPDRDTGLKVVVSTKEISASDLDEQELNMFLKAANELIARYADISLLILAVDNGEYLGSLHRTHNPIRFAMAIPSDLLASGNPVYILRLHDGVMKRLDTTVKGGYAYFESDLFSKFALAYESIAHPAEPEIVPEEPEIVCSMGAHENGRGIPETGDVSDRSLYLMFMFLAAGALLAAGTVLAAMFLKKERRM